MSIIDVAFDLIETPAYDLIENEIHSVASLDLEVEDGILTPTSDSNIANDWSEVNLSDLQSVSSMQSDSEMSSDVAALVVVPTDLESLRNASQEQLILEIARLTSRVNELEGQNAQINHELSQTLVDLHQRERELALATDVNRKQALKMFKRVDRAKKHLRRDRHKKIQNKRRGKRTERNLRKTLYAQGNKRFKHLASRGV